MDWWSLPAAKPDMGKTRVGISGWSYAEWRGDFYPEALPADKELAYAAWRFDTIEVNSTFYGLTSPAVCRRWRESAPSGFKYAVKGSRYITHIKQIGDVDTAVANFLASGILELGEKLGPILWQLPPTMRFDSKRLEQFLDLLPSDTDEATTIARRHDEGISKVSYGNGVNHRMRHVLEIRNETYLQAKTARICRDHGTALCFSQARGWPYVEEATAGFVYVRLHGPDEPYASGYDDQSLRSWSERLEAWQAGDEPDDPVRISDLEPPARKERDVYVYFDNDVGGHAPRDGTRLREIFGAV